MAGKPYPQVVLLGDSLLQHSAELKEGFSFQAALQSHFIRRLDVVNRGFSGYNTSNVLPYIPTLFQAPSDTVPKVDYLVVLLGANDAVRPIPPATQHVPQDQYRANLKSIISHPAVAAHDPKLLLVTPPPIDEIRLDECDRAKGAPEISRHAVISAQYSQIVRDIAAETPGAVCIDLWRALMDHANAKTPDYAPGEGRAWLGTFECGKQGGLADLLPDGLHMSGEAYRVFFEAVVGHIGQEWQGIAEDDRTGYLLPDWRDLAAAKK